jgi:DNA-binding transcriptional ArsR family regulator
MTTSSRPAPTVFTGDVVQAVEGTGERGAGQAGAVYPHFVLGEREGQLLAGNDRAQQEHVRRAAECLASAEDDCRGEQQGQGQPASGQRDGDGAGHRRADGARREREPLAVVAVCQRAGGKARGEHPGGLDRREQGYRAGGTARSPEIDSVEGLRALADPVRLAILSALEARGPDDEFPVMSVKEMAQRLAEPQTKLYRHVKQLEAAGLIEVAATRMVSGILEQRYRARQRDLRAEAGDVPVSVAIGFYRPTT